MSQYAVEEGDSYAEFVAEKLKCRVVYPQDNQLQLDMDTEAQFAEFERRFADLFTWDRSEQLSFPTIEITPSKSGLPHRHITLTFPGVIFTSLERVLMQTLLGSDPVREKMNTLRVIKGISKPCRLFEPKEQP